MHDFLKLSLKNSVLQHRTFKFIQTEKNPNTHLLTNQFPVLEVNACFVDKHSP
jgi:hypothetical protein